MTKKTINNKEELNNEKYNEKQRSKIICSYICCIYSVNDAVCNNNTCCNNNNKKYAFNKRFSQKFKDIDKAKRERIQMEGSK